MRPSRKYVIVNSKPLTPDELAGAFAVPDTDRRHIALLQLIGECEQQSNEVAQKNVMNDGVCKAAVGAADVLGQLRDQILELREKGWGKQSLGTQIG